MRASSSSTTEPRISGFRIVREVARDGTAVIYDAIQADLERPVTLTVLAPGDSRAERFRAGTWPQHPHVAGLYAAGASEDGFFIATRRVDGARTLRREIAEGADPDGWLADVRAALAATGAVHGALEAETSLLVGGDGRILMTGFGLAAPGATADGDERALARLEALAGRTAPPSRRPPRRPRAVLAALLAAGVALGFVLERGDGGAVPVPPTGAIALGPALTAGPVRSVDCEGEPPSGRSLACTAMQSALRGRALVVPRDGVVIAWHVRGARGDVALRVIRPRGAAAFGLAGGSDFESVGGGVRSFRAAVPVQRGDRLGLELAPGSAAGVRAFVPGATTERFIGPLASESRRPVGAGRNEELMLRADYVPGKAVERPVRLLGGAAAGAPDGRRLDERELDVAGSTTVTAALVALPDGLVAVDLFDGPRRRARITVPGADPRGRHTAFTAKGEADLTLAWRNPDGTRLETPYRVTASSIASRG